MKQYLNGYNAYVIRINGEWFNLKENHINIIKEYLEMK